jgi:lantibiotic modifying enzyme
VLTEAWRATGSEAYRRAAVRCAGSLHAAAVETEHGVRWSEVTDVIGGAAGTGLFLLDCAERLDRPQDLELAERAGRHLLSVARTEEPGRSWAMDPTFPRIMPNFSHGTAGVAYFLATLHAATGAEVFLEAALDGARHLEAIADRSDGGFRVWHHTPDGEDLFYLGWCHGPPGTARLFERLAQVTNDPSWRARTAQCLQALRTAGIPAARPPGFWNNVGICCGSAGVAEFALDLDELEFARSLADDLLTRAARSDSGLSWPQAEHRVRPELIQAQTGYMQGAAGIGLHLLHLDGALHGRTERTRLPDDPY